MGMKLQFKHQKFQADAAKAVVDVFEGQPETLELSRYMIDPGRGPRQLNIGEDKVSIGWSNNPVILTKESILDHIRTIQRNNLIEPSADVICDVPGKYNLTIEMETGVGKT